MFELEITESMLMEDVEQSIDTMNKLYDMGNLVAIDDFGTGYSSLNYLKRFPLHTLKVDRSFLADVPNDPDNKAIVTAIITMAHSLGMQVVAEGVEEINQLTFLKDLHCDFIQGFYISKPVTADEVSKLFPPHKAMK